MKKKNFHIVHFQQNGEVVKALELTKKQGDVFASMGYEYYTFQNEAGGWTTFYNMEVK